MVLQSLVGGRVSAISARSERGTRHVWMRFRALPLERRAISIEAVIALAIARVLVLTLPVRWIARRLDRQAAAISGARAEAADVMREVGWAVRAAAPKTPWKSACLVQALAGKWMLARRGLRSTIHLGVAKDSDGTLQAHAWLCAGDRVLTGGAQMRRFTRIGELE